MFKHFKVKNDNDEVVGQCWGDTGSKEQPATLDYIQTHPTKGKGRGKKLLAEFEEAVKESGASEITGQFSPERDAEKTKQFYESNGYEVDPKARRIKKKMR